MPPRVEGSADLQVRHACKVSGCARKQSMCLDACKTQNHLVSAMIGSGMLFERGCAHVGNCDWCVDALASPSK
jgi:hypothetical protein